MMGSLGSFVFFGFVIGSIASTFMMDVFSYKIVLCISMIGHASGEILFITNTNYYVVAFARFLSGFGQILLVVYTPVFLDLYIVNE